MGRGRIEGRHDDFETSPARQALLQCEIPSQSSSARTRSQCRKSLQRDRLMPKQQTLTQFPQPYPDELLYSVVARYVHRAGLRNINTINTKLFGFSHNGNALDLPSGITTIASVIPAGQQISAEKIISDHTLFDFHTAYADSEYRQQVADDMLASAAPDRRIAVRRKTVIAGARYLRFCPACQNDMIETFGEAYWRRDHQLAHVVVCPTHRIALSDSQIDAQRRSSLYYRADDTSCPADAPPVIEDPTKEEIDILSRIAARSWELSRGRTKGRVDENIRASYLDMLWRKGFFRAQKQVNKESLGISLKNHLATLKRFWPEVSSEADDAPAWALSLLKKLGFNTPTVYHILFQDFLEQQPDVKADRGRIDRRPRPQEAEIGGRPWVCYNPLITDPAHADVRVDHVRYVGPDLLIHFRCSCEYEYIRRKKPDGTFTKPTFYNFGKSLIPHIEQAMREGWALKKTARLAGSNPKTLLRQAEKLGITELPTVKGQ